MLESDLDQIMAFLERINSENMLNATKVLHQEVTEELALAPNVNLTNIVRKLDAYSALHKEWRAFRVPACRWMSVMLVSFIEAYLEDGLIGIAKKNPKVIKDAKFDSMRLFEVSTIEEMRSELQSNWAHDAIRPDGPKTWCKKLQSLGAPPLDQRVIDTVQHIWDTRNLIVHRRCIASAAYAKQYSHFGIKVGNAVEVDLSILEKWLRTLKPFVEWADQFFIRYGR